MNYAEGTILRQMMNCAPACPVFDLFKDHSLWCRNCLVSCKKAVYIDVILATAVIDLFNLLQLLLFWHMHSGPLQNRVRSGCALSYKDTRLATTLNNLVNNLPGPSSHNNRNWLFITRSCGPWHFCEGNCVVSSITMYNMWHLFVACRKQRLQFDTMEWHILHNITYVRIPIVKLQFVCTKCNGTY
jgi:ferredoxin